MQRVVVFVVLSALDIFGEIFWSIIFPYLLIREAVGRVTRAGSGCPSTLPILLLLKGDSCEFVLRREEGCTWVGGLDRMAVLYVRCCCRAEAVPAAYCG